MTKVIWFLIITNMNAGYTHIEEYKSKTECESSPSYQSGATYCVPVYKKGN